MELSPTLTVIARYKAKPGKEADLGENLLGLLSPTLGRGVCQL